MTITMLKHRAMHSVDNKTPATQNSDHSLFGETPLPFAPQIEFDNGQSVVPQQYIEATRTVKNVEEILNRISFHDDYLLFVDEQANALCLQVGIVGCENYPRNCQQLEQTKIVYGRRWLLEPNAPTSEVIQTSMLAIKKAREHELREKVFLSINQQQNRTTPFNNHIDLPLMKANTDFFNHASQDGQISEGNDIEQQLNQVLESLSIDSIALSIQNIQLLGSRRCLIDLQTKQTSTSNHFPELSDSTISVLCNDFSVSNFLHEFMQQLVTMSDRYIEENFKFDGFARFSHDICPQKIAEFSFNTRNIKHKDPRFASHFSRMSYDIDSSKAPFYASGQLGHKQRQIIREKGVNAGYLPLEVSESLVKSELA